MKKITLIMWFFVCISLVFSQLSASGKKREITGAEEEASLSKSESPTTPVVIPQDEEKLKKETTVIKGTVIDESGKSVAGVDVNCLNEEGTVIANTVTDKNGYYQFEGIEKGEYTISVSFSGFTRPIEIKFEDEKEIPQKPEGLKIFEIGRDIHLHSYIHVRWSPVKVASSYLCELYQSGRGGRGEPLAEYNGIKQNYCEFGNLEEDTDYEVRVYSKNDAGYSEEYASGTIHTQNKPPLAPFGLGVTYAKNNRIDLMWDSSRDEDLKGFIIQIKPGKDSYQYYSKNGLTRDRNKAFLVNYPGEGLVNYSIAEKLDNGTPIIEDAIPYSLRVLSVDKKGAISRPSTAVIAIIAEDTIPPNPPYDIEYEFKDTNRLVIKWKSDDRDVEKFILYYGVNKDRWDGVVSTGNNYYELAINSEQLKDRELYISIIAVDRSGNESGYKPFTRKTAVSKRESVTENIVLSSNNIYKDYSVAVKGLEIPEKKQVVKKPVKSTPVQKREYGFPVLREKGFLVKKGETAIITGKQTVPEGTRIQVLSGGSLIIHDAELKTVNGEWGGIQYNSGAGGSVRNTVIANALVGVTILNNDRIIKLRNVEISGCTRAGIEIKNSRAELTLSTFKDNNLGIHIDNGRADISNSIFENNEKGVLSKNYSLNINDSQFNGNRVYGIRLYGGGGITNCSFRKNLAGIVLEPGTGSVELSKNVVELNHMDGIVVNMTNSVISQNSISNNGRHGIYIKENANPDIFENDIVNNQEYAIIGGGKVTRCYVAYNNGSAYIDDTPEKGRPDNVLSSSSSGMVKQILNVDYINYLAYTSVLR